MLNDLSKLRLVTLRCPSAMCSAGCATDGDPAHTCQHAEALDCTLVPCGHDHADPAGTILGTFFCGSTCM